jgi:pimeloyl-ACP methyl ester carboxylesterase
MNTLARWLLGCCCLLAPAFALGESFPYADPYYATITAAILKADHLDKSLKYHDISLRLRPDRDKVPYFGRSRNKVTIRFWPAEREEAPLVVLISGLGGAASASYHNFLASQLAKRGQHALVFPSPFHWTFALAASRSGLPGITAEDAEDLYLVIQEGIRRVQARPGIRIGKVGLLGVSMGALQAAFLSEIDSRQRKVRFKSVLLINPAVDPVFSGEVLTALAREGAKFSAGTRRSLQERVYFFGTEALMMRDIKSPDYFLGLEQRLPTTPAERKFLIGSSLQEFLPALLFATQQVNDLGVLKTPVVNKDPADRLREVAGFSFQEYLEKFLLPGLGLTPGLELEKQVSLRGLAGHLADPKISLFHNQDDFIVSEEQLGFLRSVMGERMRLYSRGGHLGNLWYPQNLEAILDYFASLER